MKDSQSFACGKRAEELEFMEYDEAQWTPWFVHHFEPTVEHLAPQILEIFRNHPEAKADHEKHQVNQ